MRKVYVNLTLAFLFFMLGLTLSSQISKKLWGIDYIGVINDVKYSDDTNAIITTKQGVLSLLDLNKKEISVKKNSLNENNILIESTDKFSILFDEINGSADIIENSNLKIKNSINLSSNNYLGKALKIRINELKEKNPLIGIYLENTNLKIFNEEKIIRHFESNESDIFIDFSFNTKTLEVLILSFDTNAKKIKVSILDLKVKTNKIDYFFEYSLPEFSFESSKCLLTNESFLLYNNSDYTFVFGKFIQSNNSYEIFTGKFDSFSDFQDCRLDEINLHKYLAICNSRNNKKISFILDPMVNSNSKTFNLTFGEDDLITDIFYNNKDNKKEKLLFIVRKSLKNNHSTVEALLYEKEKSSFKSLETKNLDLLDEEKIRFIRGNFINLQKGQYSYIIVSNINQIRYVHVENSIYVILNQKYLNIVKSEIITVNNFEKKKRSKPILNTLTSLIQQRDFTKVLKNAYNLFISDIQDIFSNISSSIENLININKITTKEIISNKNERHFLILFSSNNELFILDAISGEKKFEKRFPNYTLTKIRTPTSQNSINLDSKNDYFEIDNNINNAVINLELKNLQNKTEDILIFQINLRDFSYQEIDFNIKTYFSLDTLGVKINRELNNKNFKEVIEFTLPDSVNEFDSNHKKINMNRKIILNYNHIQNTLYAMKINIDSTSTEYKNTVFPIWNFKLNNHKLLDYKLAKVPENFHTVYNSSGKILYKHIDHNIILILANVENTQIVNVTLINIINGKILFQTQILNVDLNQKINSIFDENYVIINYVKKNKNILRNEVFTIEIMRREIEHSLISLFHKLFNFKNLFSAFNPTDEELIEMGKIQNKENLANEEELIHSDDLVFLTKTFFIPRRVKNIFLNKTKLNVANKYIIFLLESNQAFLVDKRNISPRRPFAKFDPRAPNSPPVIDPLMNSPYADLETTPYFPNIILDPKFIVDIDFSNSQIEDIHIQPTKFESTFILCTTGLSLNCYKVFPDKTFDYFVSIFPNVFILIALVILFVFTFTFRRYVKKMELKQLFLNS